MSSIGPSGFLPISLAGNAAANAAQQKEHQQLRDVVASKNFERDLKLKTEQAKSDISDPELSQDRDADGRLFSQEETPSPPQDANNNAEDPPQETTRSVDPDQIVGTLIDFDA